MEMMIGALSLSLLIIEINKLINMKKSEEVVVKNDEPVVELQPTLEEKMKEARKKKIRKLIRKSMMEAVA